LNTANPLTIPVVDSAAAARRSFLLVFLCTLIGALAQMLMKVGAGQLTIHVTLPDVLHDPLLVVSYGLAIVSNPRLFAGYALYGVNTFLMSAALKGRELSRIYPIIALTFVWVTILSVVELGERLNAFRIAGIILIVGGVSVLGMKKAGATA
jgi:multidrug transporter EmrE-like cation transporter